MVQIPIKPGILHPDWILIDLQGSLESNVSELKGLSMGTLTTTDKDKAVLVISHHRLEGEVVKLKKPFAVLEKRHSEETTETEYHVVALLRKKYVFSARPQPLVGGESKGRSTLRS